MRLGARLRSRVMHIAAHLNLLIAAAITAIAAFTAIAVRTAIAAIAAITARTAFTAIAAFTAAFALGYPERRLSTHPPLVSRHPPSR